MFDEYSSKIKKMKSFTRNDILTADFLLYNDDRMKIYYAPHNEIINLDAKIFIIGITPGWTQTAIAYETANKGLIANLNSEEIKINCKRNSRFAGSMRKNLVAMLDELELNKKLQLNSCEELFNNHDELLHTTSIIPYPVFINDKNYTGSNPKILDNEILTSYMKKYFYKEIGILSDALIIPLGKSVEEILKTLISENVITEEQCLLGFPHPSGANGHRKNNLHLIKDSCKKKFINLFVKIFDFFRQNVLLFI